MIASLALLALVAAAGPARAGGNVEISEQATRLMTESARIERLIADANERVNRGEQEIKRAESVIELAREEKDQQALAIATEARNLGEDTVARARAERVALEKKLGEIEALLGRGRDVAGEAPVLEVKGGVYVKTKLGYVKVGPNFRLRRGEEIHTEHDGLVTLGVDDNGSRIRLGPDSAFTRLDSNDVELGLSIGQLKAEIARLTERRYAVRTPTAVAGVRGTVFEVLASDEATECRVYSGQVEVTPREGRRSVLVGPRQKVIVDKSGNVIGPGPLDVSERGDPAAPAGGRRS